MNDDWRKEQYPDLIAVALGATLMMSPWIAGLRQPEAAIWNAVLSGQSVVLLGLAALIAAKAWQIWCSLVMALWIAAAPWLTGFAPSQPATRIHLLIGLCLSATWVLKLGFGHGSREPSDAI